MNVAPEDPTHAVNYLRGLCQVILELQWQHISMWPQDSPQHITRHLDASLSFSVEDACSDQPFVCIGMRLARRIRILDTMWRTQPKLGRLVYMAMYFIMDVRHWFRHGNWSVCVLQRKTCMCSYDSCMCSHVLNVRREYDRVCSADVLMGSAIVICFDMRKSYKSPSKWSVYMILLWTFEAYSHNIFSKAWVNETKI